MLWVCLLYTGETFNSIFNQAYFIISLIQKTLHGFFSS